jgi:hypothetical protein
MVFVRKNLDLGKGQSLIVFASSSWAGLFRGMKKA